MPKAVRKSLAKELNEVKDDVLSAELSICMQLVDDFVIENASSEVCEDTDDNAQNYSGTENSELAEEFLPEPVPTENMILPTEWQKEVLVDQQYWEQKGAAAKSDKNSRVKYPASQRLTVTEINKIALHNTVNRDPAYFKFNISTTGLLNTLIEKKVVGSFQNVIGTGDSAVVIHARHPDSYNTHGIAVKVYKLSGDVMKNNAILKRAKREYEHLVTLKYCRVPYIKERMKNIIILDFLGQNQESMPSLSSLPSEYDERVYELIVKDIKKWYTECGIVHGKLCQKSILYDTTVYPSYCGYDDMPCRPYIVGWGHSVKKDHPRALMKLMRDCYFITDVSQPPKS